MTVGIYKIEAPSGGAYVGSSKNCEVRINHHRASLLRGKHHNPALSEAFKKYPRQITFKIVDECSPKNLRKLEQMYINKLGARSYNMAPSIRGGMLSKELRAKMSAHSTRLNADPEYTAKRSATLATHTDSRHATKLQALGLLLLSDVGRSTLYKMHSLARQNKSYQNPLNYTPEQLKCAFNVHQTANNRREQVK